MNFKDVKKPVFVEIFFRYLWENKTDVCGIIAANLAKVQAFECRWSETREEVG